MGWAINVVNVATGYSVAHAFAALPDPSAATSNNLSSTPSLTIPYIAQGLRPV